MTRPIPYLTLKTDAEVDRFVEVIYGAGLRHSDRSQTNSRANLKSRLPATAYLDLRADEIYAMKFNELARSCEADALSRTNSPAHFVSAVRAARRPKEVLPA